MNLLRRTLSPFAAALLASGSLLAPLAAQLDETPQSLNAKATELMEQAKWKEALEPLTRCVEQFDEFGLDLYGPQFGITWYRKGFCELKLEQYEEAMKSFETCHTKYPAEGEDGGRNVFNVQSLLRWGEAAQGAEQWGTAIDLYKRYLEKRNPERDKFEPGAFYVQLAICHFKLGQLDEGIEHLETALKNRLRWGTPPAAILAAFKAMSEAAMNSGKEDAMLGFVRRNRGALVFEPWEMQPYLPLYYKLGGEAFNKQLQRVALELYGMVPDASVIASDIEAQIERLGDRAGLREGRRIYAKERLGKSLEQVRETAAGTDPPEVTQLGVAAFLHESRGNVRGANAAYRQLEERFANSKRRETHLYNYVRTSSILGRVSQTEELGSRFLAAYPESEHAPAVRRLMLSSLFFTGRYEDAARVASQLLPKLEKGSGQHDLALHVLGGSYFYTGRYQDAQPLLDEHVETYPESEFATSSAFFRASNLTRLQFWTKAARMLDSFLADYPDPADNIYYPFALYDRANAHYALDENDAALEKLGRIESEFADTEVAPMALTLEGNIHQSLNQPAEAEEVYKKALELAEQRGNETVAGESLYALIGLIGEKPSGDGEGRLAEALPYVDRFWESYGADSPYKAQVAVAQVPALNQAGRGDEAIQRLQGVITELANRPGAAGLEAVVNAYTEVYLEKHGPEDLKTHYYSFPGIRFENKAARALLRIAVIGVFEELLGKTEEEDERIRAEAGIRALFKDLRDDFDLKDLSNFILVRVGDFIRGTNSPREAIPYYTEVLENDDPSNQFAALFGRAAVLAEGSESEKRRAIQDFRRVMTESQERDDKDRALYRIVGTQLELGEFDQVVENARRYLDPQDGYQTYKGEVALMLAEAYDKMGRTEDAIANYFNIASGNFRGAIRISAPAIKRNMELLWDRNRAARDGRPSDRQGAYNLGRDYVEQTERLIDRMTDEEVEQWREVERLVERYVADPNVKTR